MLFVILKQDVITGGTDTTTTIFEWTKKVQAELADVVGMNNTVEESHLPQLKYLDATLQETFRLHPPSKLLRATPYAKSNYYNCCYPDGSSTGKIFILNIGAVQTDPQLWT